jgi:PPP family 3-phenylpropionic acid transporter
MRPLSSQFFLCFAVLGSLLSYLTVYLVEERGLSEAQAGLLYGFHGLSLLVTPVVLTMFADTRVTNRALIGACFGGSAAGMAAMLLGPSVAWVVVGYLVFRLAFSPVMSLQDGLAFAEQHARQRAGQAVRPYHATRVWGTYGFLGGNALIYAFLQGGWPIWVAVSTAVGWCGLGLVNATRLPAFEESRRARGQSVPTADAIRKLLEPRQAGFCAAMLLLFVAASSYYAFYPLWLVREAGLAPKWIGVIASLGVVLEIVPILGLGWLVRRVGLRALLLVGVGCMVVRFVWLASDASVFTAVANQVLHGLMVVAVHVAPPVYLNHHAQPSYRSSIQGVYSMAVIGTGQLVGPAIAGQIAGVGLPWVFVFAAATSAVAGLLLTVSIDTRADRTVAT